MHSNNTSGYTGVNWRPEKGKWSAQITMRKRSIPLGYFSTAIEASEAFQRARRMREQIHAELRMFKRLARDHGIYMVPASCLNMDNNTIKYLSFKEDGLLEAIDDVFGEGGSS